MKGKDFLYELIAKDLSSEITEEEKKILEERLHENEAEQQRYNTLNSFWNSYFPHIENNNVISKTEKKLQFTYHSTAKSITGWMLKVAVSILVIFTLTYAGIKIWTKSPAPQINEYYSKANEIKHIVLSDGTEVWLNSYSMLFTMEPFDGNERKVTLIGEGYFEVAHDLTKPFIVQTQNMTTKVLGTHFNIISYPQEDKQIISLYEGKVELSSAGNTVNNVILNPGQKAEFNNLSGKFNVVKTDLGEPALWRDGILRFYDEDFTSIAKKLEHKFQTRIIISDEQVGKLRFTANFEEESLTKIIQLLNEAHRFKYKVTESGIIIESI